MEAIFSKLAEATDKNTEKLSSIDKAIQKLAIHSDTKDKREKKQEKQDEKQEKFLQSIRDTLVSSERAQAKARREDLQNRRRKSADPDAPAKRLSQTFKKQDAKKGGMLGGMFDSILNSFKGPLLAGAAAAGLSAGLVAALSNQEVRESFFGLFEDGMKKAGEQFLKYTTKSFNLLFDRMFSTLPGYEPGTGNTTGSEGIRGMSETIINNAGDGLASIFKGIELERQPGMQQLWRAIDKIGSQMIYNRKNPEIKRALGDTQERLREINKIAEDKNRILQEIDRVQSGLDNNPNKDDPNRQQAERYLAKRKKELDELNKKLEKESSFLKAQGVTQGLSRGGWITGPQSGYPVSLTGQGIDFIGHGTEYVVQRSSGGFVIPVDTPHTRSDPSLTGRRIQEAKLSGFSEGGDLSSKKNDAGMFNFLNNFGGVGKFFAGFAKGLGLPGTGSGGSGAGDKPASAPNASGNSPFKPTGKWGKVLKLIADAESGSGGYEAMFPSTRLRGATNMTIAEVERRASGAVGMWQNMPRFLIDRAKAVGLDPHKDLYNEENQRTIAEYLIGPGQANVTMNMAKNNPEEAMIRLSRVWAAIPVPKAMQGHNKMLSKGESYYAGDGTNKAHITPQQMYDAFSSLSMGGPIVKPDMKYISGGPTNNDAFRAANNATQGQKVMTMISQPIIINGGGDQSSAGSQHSPEIPQLPTNPGNSFASSLVMTKNLLSDSIGG